MGSTWGEGWTDERVAKLTKLWTVDGLSASQCARELGGVTRMAVLGKVNRLGLHQGGGAVRQKPASPKTVHGDRRQFNRAPKPPQPPVLKIAGRGTVFEEAEVRPPRVVVPITDEAPGRRSIMDIGFGQCRWVCAPVDGLPTFCGGAASGSWCSDHAARVFTPLPAGRPRTGNELARSLRRYA